MTEYEYGVQYSTAYMENYVVPSFSLQSAEDTVANLKKRSKTFFNPRIVRRPVVSWEEIDDYQPGPSCTFIPGGPKNAEGQLEPKPSCTCGAVMPKGIKTTPGGWFYGHEHYGWNKVN